jgi:hypothetical protein
VLASGLSQRSAARLSSTVSQTGAAYAPNKGFLIIIIWLIMIINLIRQDAKIKKIEQEQNNREDNLNARQHQIILPN